ncbi:beta-ketoacyl-ACP synthase III [Dysgonomonas massiliensis]|uniref:beta-ketoacyl-ACP synthase III n=1 Tax=Dysgonomonas massiliensis TaxID=2040292 RepID=UPI000C78B858|nr:beta-ketoacyl-ACP synthase III [Dysgonomonas massiliensis]
MVHAAITGISASIPEAILTNEELSKIVDTNDEWIMSRVGIKERHVLKGEGQGISVLGIDAVKKLLEKTNTKPEEVDVIIFATTTPDYSFPSSASLVAEGCGIANALGFDIQAACSGFIYALEIGSNFIKSGNYKKVVIIGGDKMTSITNYEDRTTCPLFGDAAGAVMLEPTTENVGVIDSLLHIDGKGVSHLHMYGGGSAYPSSKETVEKKMHYVYQEGQAVYKNAVTRMSDASVEIMERNNLTNSDVNWFVAHQANIRIIEAVGRRMGLSDDQVLVNIEKYGNTSAATIPVCLWENESKLKKGDNIILTAFGAGFTWGSVYLKWAY